VSDPPSPPPPPERTLSRRTVLGRGLLLGAAAAAVGSGLYAWQVEPFWWEMVYRDLPVENLPTSLAGKTLVQVSDFHAGPRVPGDYLVRALASVASLRPDVVVITGDLVHTGDPSDLADAARALDALGRAPLGTLAILGNHDYGAGWTDAAAAQRVVRCLGDHGATVLRNEVATVEGLEVAGLDDLWARRFDPRAALPRLDPRGASLVLCHNPDGVDRPGWGAWRGWVLAGHTHGGQVKLPFLPPPVLPVENRRYDRGAFDLGDGRRLYVNAGLGYLRQVRLGVRPEITVFRLLPA